MFERQDDTQRFFVPAHGPGGEPVRTGLMWLRTYAEGHLYADAAIWLPTKDHVSELGTAIGQAAADRLKRTGKVRMGSITVSLFTSRTLRSIYKDGPLLALWAAESDLDQLDAV